MKRIAIIHTTTATVDSLKALAQELLPGCEVINFVDDSILPRLAVNGGNVEEVTERLVAYAQFAAAEGADLILEACSSVGEVVPKMQAVVDIPVVRIDSALAREAIARGTRIAVAATLPTTLGPTTRLLHETAAAQHKTIEMRSQIVEGAYDQLMAGDRARHDALLLEALEALARQADVVVLAQASMARVLSQLPEDLQGKILSSPLLAMQNVRSIMSV